MMLYAAFSSALIFASPGTLQSLGGIALHDGREKVREVIPNGREVQVGGQSDPLLTMISDGGQTVWFCDGIVSQVRQQAPGNLIDYAREVAAREARHGAPEIRSYYVTYRNEHLARVEASWTVEATVAQVGIIDPGFVGGVRMEVFKSIRDPSLCFGDTVS